MTALTIPQMRAKLEAEGYAVDVVDVLFEGQTGRFINLDGAPVTAADIAAFNPLGVVSGAPQPMLIAVDTAKGKGVVQVAQLVTGGFYALLAGQKFKISDGNSCTVTVDGQDIAIDTDWVLKDGTLGTQGDWNARFKVVEGGVISV